MEQEGLAITLTKPTLGPQPVRPSVVDQIRKAVGQFMTRQTPPRNPEETQWRDVRPGKSLDEYLKKEGIN